MVPTTVVSRRTLCVGTLSHLGTLSPWQVDDSATALMLTQVFEPPFATPVGSSPPAPLLFAEQLRPEQGGAFSGAVRPGVTFSDGSPCDAAAVSESLLRVKALTDVARVAVVSGRIVLTPTREGIDLAGILAQPYCGIAKVVGTNVIGTGPFLSPERTALFVAQKATELIFRANPRAWRPTTLEAICFRVFSGIDALTASVRSGDVHVAYVLNQGDLSALRDARITQQELPGTSTGILFLNTQSFALRHPVVRRAICAVVDRTRIARESHKRFSLPAQGILPPFLGKSAAIGKAQPNVAEAKRLLASEKLIPPRRLTLLLTWGPKTYLPNPAIVGTAVSNALRELDIELNIIVPDDRNQYVWRQERGGYDLVASGWIADTSDPADYLDSLLHSSSILEPKKDAPAANNLARLSAPELDAALDAYRRTRTDAALAAVMRIVDAHAAVIPLMHGGFIAVSSRSIRGFTPSPLGYSSLGDVTFA